MSSREPYLVIRDLSGGLNVTDPPESVPENQVCEAYDVEWYQSTMPRKRNSPTKVTVSGFSPSGNYAGLFRHTPQGASGETATELWALTTDPALGRWQSGGWSTITLLDTLSEPEHAQAQSFRNKFFWAYNSTADRLHVWDGTSFRRAGLATPAAPTVANTGSGSYAATIRYYKVAYTEVVSATVRRRSELSAAQSFTPSGSGTHARVTKPAALSEGETHWELYGSADGTNYYLITSTVVGTTTYDDSANPSTYSSGTLADDAGANTAFPSARVLAALDNRLFLARSWEDDAYDSRVWWGPVFGTTGLRDEERLDATGAYYVDVDPGVHGPIRGLGVAGGNLIVFKSSAIYKLVPTGDIASPYVVVQITPNVGLLHQRSVVNAVDEYGQPVIAWLARRGPYRYGPQGIQYLGRDIESIWDNWTASTERKAFGVYYSDRSQIWWWFAAGTTAYASTLLVLDVQKGRSVGGVVRGGWTNYTGSIVLAAHAAMHSSTIDGSGTGVFLKPYFGLSTAALSGAELWKGDSTSTVGDPTVGSGVIANFAAWVVTRPYMVGGEGINGGVTEVEIHAKALASTTVAVGLIADYGVETRTFTTSIAAAASETRVVRKLEDAALTEARVVQFDIGDHGSASAKHWQMDALVARVRDEQAR
jgi:hypothetical protein